MLIEWVSGMGKTEELRKTPPSPQASGDMAFPFSDMGKFRKAAYLGEGGVENQEFSFGVVKFETRIWIC